jgi:hypothetical protein
VEKKYAAIGEKMVIDMEAAGESLSWKRTAL